MQAFKDELRVSEMPKKNSLFVGYFSIQSNKEKRKLVPQGKKLLPIQHFRQMHASTDVLSPDGDRPDCYRHYEAIGLNAMPITQMNPKYFRHLAGIVIFNNTNWNLNDLKATLQRSPRVYHRLVFEEYWMEYLERLVGRPLRWYDSSRELRCSLADITDTMKRQNHIAPVKSASVQEEYFYHHPFPYGLPYVEQGGSTPADFNPDAKSMYLNELKHYGIFVGYITSIQTQYGPLTPSGEKMPTEEYYKTMHESMYVLSPDGDRPECYRHNEAIGLGTMPMTSLNPILCRLLAGNVVFNETKWDIRNMEAKVASESECQSTASL